jgi:hypothetical protein
VCRNKMKMKPGVTNKPPMNHRAFMSAVVVEDQM